jgi:hypothetical protein
MPDGLQLAPKLIIERRSLGGPFGSGALPVGPASAPLFNGSVTAITVASVRLSPLVEERTSPA